MKQEEFNVVLDTVVREIARKNRAKGLEYSRSDDRFHNFWRGCSFFDTTKEKYLLYLMSKHLVSIMDMVDDLAEGVHWDTSVWMEKITDAILYLVILYAMQVENQSGK